MYGNEWDTSEGAEAAIYAMSQDPNVPKLKHVKYSQATTNPLEKAEVKKAWAFSYQLFSPMPSAELPLPFQRHFRQFDPGYSSLSCPSGTLLMNQPSITVPRDRLTENHLDRFQLSLTKHESADIQTVAMG